MGFLFWIRERVLNPVWANIESAFWGRTLAGDALFNELRSKAPDIYTIAGLLSSKGFVWKADPAGGNLDYHSFPRVTCARKKGDCLWVGEPVILKDKATHQYAVRRLGDIKSTYDRYDALSYNEHTQKWEFKPITQYLDKGRKPVYEVKARDGRSFLATSGHKVYVILSRTIKSKGSARTDHELRVVTVRDLLKFKRTGTLLGAKYVQLVSAASIPALDMTPLDLATAEVMGFYLAEGYVSGRKMGIAQDKPHFRVQIERALKAAGMPFSASKRTTNAYYTILKRGEGSGFDLLSELGYNSFTMKLPERYLSISAEAADRLLLAYGNGDAWQVPPTDPRYPSLRCIYGTSSEELRNAVMFLGLLTGRRMSPWLQEHHQGCGSSPIWRVSERKDNPHSRVCGSFDGLRSAPLLSIREVGTKRVCDISVADNHNFLTQDGLLVHNCDDYAFLWEELLRGYGECWIMYTYTKDEGHAMCVFKSAQSGGYYLLSNIQVYATSFNRESFDKFFFGDKTTDTRYFKP